MCDPITLAGAALTAGSMFAKSSAADDVSDARNRALLGENARMQGFRSEAAGVNKQAQDRYRGFVPQQEARGRELGSFFTGQNTPAVPLAPSIEPRAASPIVAQEEAKQRGAAAAYGNQQGTALGNLRSFGDLMGELSRGTARDAGTIGQIGSFMRGSSNVLPFELDAAGHAGDTAKMWGDILGGVGSLATTAGLSGAGGGMPLGFFFGRNPMGL